MTEESGHLSDLHLEVKKVRHELPPDAFRLISGMIAIACIEQGIPRDAPLGPMDPLHVIAWLHQLLCQCQDKDDTE